MRFLIFLAGAGLYAQALLSPAEIALNVESFDKVWTTIRDKHWQEKPGGLDWDAVRTEYRPQVERAKTMREARAVLSAMLGRLKQTHFGILAADDYADLEDIPGGDGWTGIDVRVLGNECVVTSVAEGSPAAQAGVRLGWTVDAIDGRKVAPVIERIRKSADHGAELMLYRPLLARLNGRPGSIAEVVFVDGANRRKVMKLARVRPKGELASFGYLPLTLVTLETRKLPENIGFVALNIFLDPARVLPAFGEFVQSCATCKGLIIDLRGNPGGIGAMAMGMAGWLVDTPGKRLGVMQMRDNELKFVIFPRAETFDGPLAILLDGASASTSEIFAGGMKDLGRAKIFGTRSAAAALPSSIEKLPNRDYFQYAQANYISEGGKPLEGIGVIPDFEVRLTREVLLKGRDPVVDAAVQWILKQEKK
jgi:carboxyl-terminal processing protease